MQIKFFQSKSYYSDKEVSSILENEINTWLQSHSEISVFKIESDVMGHSIITRIWYEG